MGPRFVRALSRPGSAVLVALALTAASMVQSTAAPPSTMTSQVALDWNTIAVKYVRLTRTPDGVPPGQNSDGTPLVIKRPFAQPEGNLYVAYVQLAVYDAVVKIAHRYQIYHQFSFDGAPVDAGVGDASPDAAVIAAAYNALADYVGPYLTQAQNDSLAADYAASRALLPRGERTDRGIAVGEASAADIRNLRANDGRNAVVPSDTCPTPTNPPTPGSYVCAGPPPVTTPQQIAAPIMVTPWLAHMQPFMLNAPDQFRVGAPPAPGSDLFKRDFDETRALGSFGSTVRTADQTATAIFWTANFIDQLQQTLRDFTTQHQMDLVDTVRVLAMGGTVETDAEIACWDSKYAYMYWRPLTAIRAAKNPDGSPLDPMWKPLRATPNHPEYPSAHACADGALTSMVAGLLGTTNIDLTMAGIDATGATVYRTYPDADTLSSELRNARVWVGFHYRNSTEVGDSLGQTVAEWTLQRFFLPTD